MNGAKVRLIVYGTEGPLADGEKAVADVWFTFPKECLSIDQVAMSELVKGKLLTILDEDCKWGLEK